MERGQTSEKKKVMVAIDESESSRYALEWALQYLHETLVNAELVIFTTQPIADYNYIYASAFGSTSPELLTTIQEKQKKTAIALLKDAQEICSEHGISADTTTEVGDPQKAICEAVEKLKIELLVVGSHGSRGLLKRVFMGSVSKYLVKNAKCSVLVVRGKARHD